MCVLWQGMWTLFGMMWNEVECAYTQDVIGGSVGGFMQDMMLWWDVQCCGVV